MFLSKEQRAGKAMLGKQMNCHNALIIHVSIRGSQADEAPLSLPFSSKYFGKTRVRK